MRRIGVFVHPNCFVKKPVDDHIGQPRIRGGYTTEGIIPSYMELGSDMCCQGVINKCHIPSVHRGMTKVDPLPTPTAPFVSRASRILQGLVQDINRGSKDVIIYQLPG
jgi:hypothetical protein